MNFNSSIPRVNPSQLQYMKQIDCNDCYRNVQEQGIIRCQICKLSIAKNNVFEHTMSKRHKYNKLLFSIAQDCSRNVEVNFIVLNIDRLQCRYCDSLIINSDENDLVIKHIQDSKHITRRQNYLDSKSIGLGSNSDVEYNLLKPLDRLITYSKKIKKLTKQAAQKDAIREGLLEESKQLRDINNVDQCNASQCSVAPKNEQVQSGTEFSSCISIRENGTAICTLCLVHVPNNPYCIDIHVNDRKHKEAMKTQTELPNFIRTVKTGTCSCIICLIEFPNIYSCINEHINGKNHKKAMLQSMQSTSKSLKPKDVAQGSREWVSETLLLTPKVTNKPAPKPVQLLNTYKTTEIMTNLRETDKIGQDRLSQCSAASNHKELKSGIELPDCMSIAENGAYICTPCCTEVPKTTSNITEHIDGKKHKKATLRLMQSTSKSLKPKDVVQTGVKSTDCIRIGENGACMCTLCLVKVPNTPHDIDMHVNGKKHKEALKIESELPYFVSSVKNGTRSCTICLIEFPNKLFWINDHINGEKHKNATLKLM